MLAVVVAGCGGGAPKPGACVDDPPSTRDTYANPDVAFGTPEGEVVQSDRAGGALPWFAKAGLYVRGDQEVVIRVRAADQDVVRLRGWGLPAGQTGSAVLVRSGRGCWTAHPGGIQFAGRRCVRLDVEGPAGRRGSVHLGLRKACVT